MKSRSTTISLRITEHLTGLLAFGIWVWCPESDCKDGNQRDVRIVYQDSWTVFHFENAFVGLPAECIGGTGCNNDIESNICLLNVWIFANMFSCENLPRSSQTVTTDGVDSMLNSSVFRARIYAWSPIQFYQWLSR